MMEQIMTEIMDMALSTWERYWNGSLYYIFPAAAVVYLMIWGKKNTAARALAVYQILIAAVFFCPVTAWVIQKCVGDLVYWRVIWLFPIVPITAYAMTHCVKAARNRVLKFILSVIFVLCIASAGTSVWQAGNFVRTGNRQQIPDEIAAISAVIEENRSSEASLVAADDHVASYLRVYNPSIRMPYGREARGAKTKNARYLYKNVMSAEPSYKRITARAKMEGCEFLVLAVPDRKMIRIMDRHGFALVEKIGNYGVFKETEQ